MSLGARFKFKLETVVRIACLIYSFCRDESYDYALNEAAIYDETIKTLGRGTVADWYN